MALEGHEEREQWGQGRETGRGKGAWGPWHSFGQMEQAHCKQLLGLQAMFSSLSMCNWTDLHSFIQEAWCRYAEAIRAGRISNVEVIDNCCVLAVVGQQMCSRKGVAATVFAALAKANINIRCCNSDLTHLSSLFFRFIQLASPLSPAL